MCNQIIAYVYRCLYSFIYSLFESREELRNRSSRRVSKHEELDALSWENDVVPWNLLCLCLNYYATNYDRDGHDARKIFRLSNQASSLSRFRPAWKFKIT